MAKTFRLGKRKKKYCILYCGDVPGAPLRHGSSLLLYLTLWLVLAGAWHSYIGASRSATDFTRR